MASRLTQSTGATGERNLVRLAIIETNHCERLFARSLDKPHASTSRASWRCNDEIDLR
jgi:hypothetical protein